MWVAVPLPTPSSPTEHLEQEADVCRWARGPLGGPGNVDESSRHDAEGRKPDGNEDVLYDILEQAKPNCVNKVRALGAFEADGMLPGKGREGPSGKVAMLDSLIGA